MPLAQNLFPGAVSTANDFKKSLEEWLVDGHAISSPLQDTKTQILALVDDLVARLGA